MGRASNCYHLSKYVFRLSLNAFSEIASRSIFSSNAAFLFSTSSPVSNWLTVYLVRLVVVLNVSSCKTSSAVLTQNLPSSLLNN